MNTQMYYGRSVGDQAKAETFPGHVNAEPCILMEGVSTINLQQHHNCMPHQMNFDSSIFSNVYYPFVAPLAGPSGSTVPQNFESRDHLMSPYNNMTTFGGSSEEFGRNRFKERYGSSYKRENAETGVATSHSGPYESTGTSVNTPINPRHLYYRHPPQDGGGTEFLSVADNIHDGSVRVRSGSAGINFIHPTHYNGYIEGSHGAQSLQPAGPFPCNQTLAGNPFLGLVGWNHPPAMPYMPGCRDHNLHQVPQIQGMSDHGFHFFPQVPAPYFPLPNGIINIPMENPIDHRPRRSSRQIIVETNRPQIRAIPEAMRLHCDIPYLTYVDEVAIIDLPEHYNFRRHSDDHSDMRMDIENMSYEELLALGEHIGNVNTCLSEEIIANQLQTRQYELAATYAEAEESQSGDSGTTCCIICLDDYESQEELGYLDCGHNYHADCLKKWLLVQNVCPVCKKQALPS